MDHHHDSRSNDPTPAPRPALSLVPTPFRIAIERDDYYARRLRQLAALCGGAQALETLNADPIVDEPFDSASVPETDRVVVEEILETLESACDRFLDEELRTIGRRLVAAAAAHDVRPLRGRAAPKRAAAALIWIMLRGNMQLGPRRRLTGELLWERLGVSNCSSLGITLAQKMRLLAPTDIATFDRLPSKDIALGDVRLLHSTTRAWLIRTRDQSVRDANQLAAQREEHGLLTIRSDGQVELRSREVKVIMAAKGVSHSGRASIMLLLGDDPMNPKDVLALSVPDAHDLVTSLRMALDAPIPRAAS